MIIDDYFEKIKIENKDLIENYINKTNSNYIKLFDWNFIEFTYDDGLEYKYKIIDDYLYIFVNKYNKEKQKKEFYFYPPFGEYKKLTFEKSILKIFNIIKIDKLNFNFIHVNMIKYFTQINKKNNINIRFDKSQSDYIYSIKDFKKCIRKTCIKNFIEEYNITYEVISEENKYICLDIQEDWCKIKKNKNGCKECNYCSKKALKNILNNFTFFKLKGILVKNNKKNEYIAFSIVILNKNDITFYELKAQHIQGLNYYIFDVIIKLFCSNVNNINFTVDYGIENIRNYKQHLCKNYKLLNKYKIKLQFI